MNSVSIMPCKSKNQMWPLEFHVEASAGQIENKVLMIFFLLVKVHGHTAWQEVKFKRETFVGSKKRRKHKPKPKCTVVTN